MDTSKPTENYFSVPRWFLDLRNQYNRVIWQRAYRRAQKRAALGPYRPMPKVSPAGTPKADATQDATSPTLGPRGHLNPPADAATKGVRRSPPWES